MRQSLLMLGITLLGLLWHISVVMMFGDIRVDFEARRAVSKHGPIGTTISIGVAEVLPDETSMAAPLARADAALYRAKENGRNRVEPAASPSSPSAAATRSRTAA